MSGAWDAAARVVDEIDELVDWQLSKDPTGYDHNTGQPECCRCGDDWHGLAVTGRMERMRQTGRFDEDYRHAEDDSPVLCPASGEEGPLVPLDVWVKRTIGPPPRAPRPVRVVAQPRVMELALHLAPLLDDLYSSLPSPLGNGFCGIVVDGAAWDAAIEDGGAL